MTRALHTDALSADASLPTLGADMLERLALTVSARLRGRLAAAETRIAMAPSEDARFLAQDAADEIAWLLARIDLHVAIARDHRGGVVAIDPALHDVLTANGKLTAFPVATSAPDPRDAPAPVSAVA